MNRSIFIYLERVKPLFEVDCVDLEDTSLKMQFFLRVGSEFEFFVFMKVLKINAIQRPGAF